MKYNQIFFPTHLSLFKIITVIFTHTKKLHQVRFILTQLGKQRHFKAFKRPSSKS